MRLLVALLLSSPLLRAQYPGLVLPAQRRIESLIPSPSPRIGIVSLSTTREILSPLATWLFSRPLPVFRMEKIFEMGQRHYNGMSDAAANDAVATMAQACRNVLFAAIDEEELSKLRMRIDGGSARVQLNEHLMNLLARRPITIEKSIALGFKPVCGELWF
ncbi:unnamed protein product, partial [Mesorhabditis belari]|uniref:Uncharacterized protein n=1 Tax=Mesorhabditis belari TaxID=2138241 RepID=A0AAF3FAV2_9BILA